MTVQSIGAAVTNTVARATQSRRFADDGQSLTLSVWDAAKAVGVGREPFYGLIREGRVKVLRIGSRIRVPRAELEAFVIREAK
jgi:excisionase family DNA binding protein